MANLKFDNIDVTAAGDWGNRQAGLFIDSMIKSAAVLNRFTIVDGVKDKLNVPVFTIAPDGSPADGYVTGANCSFVDDWTADITEKEMSVENFSWGFKNCKDALESSYRSVMLKQGQLNPETMDAEFRGWIFDRFAKVASEKALNLAGTDLISKMKGESSYTDAVPSAQVLDLSDASAHAAGDLEKSAEILGVLEDAYQLMSSEMVSAVHGDADREFRPAIFLGTGAYQAYQIAIANLHTTTPAGIISGEVPTYYGMEVIHFSSVTAGNAFIAAPTNMVLLTDDYNDVRAIGSEYEPREHAEYLYGRFKLGFDFMKGDEIVLIKD